MSDRDIIRLSHGARDNIGRWYSGHDIIYRRGAGTFVPARWRRMARWWFDVRCWVAENVLRVPVGDDW